MFLSWSGKNCSNEAGKFSFIHLFTILPLDFHLFQSLQKFLNGKIFNSLEDCKKLPGTFLAQRVKKFWRHTIMKLPEKWQKLGEKMVNALFNKVLGESEKWIIYFYLKTEGTLYPTPSPETGHGRIIYTMNISNL